MKRWLKCLLLLVLVGALVVGLWSPSSAKTKDGKWKFIYVGTNIYGDWATPVKNGMQHAADMIGNVEWKWVGDEGGDVPKVIDTCWTVVNDPSVDALMTAAYDPVSHDAVIQAAKDRGLPSIFLFADDPTSVRDTFVGQDPFEKGRTIGTKLLNYLQEGDHVGIFTWGPQEELLNNADGCGEILEQHGITWEHISAGTGEVAVAQGIVESYIRARPELDGVVAIEGIVGAGLALTMRKLGKGRLKVAAAGNLVPAALEALRDGYLDFMFDTQIYLIGYYGIMASYMGVTRGYGPAHLDPGMVFVDSSNFDEIMALIEQGYF